jgi:hypothetical protein
MRVLARKKSSTEIVITLQRLSVLLLLFGQRVEREHPNGQTVTMKPMLLLMQQPEWRKAEALLRNVSM